MKNSKKLLVLLLVLLVCLVVVLIVQIYAKYLTAASGDTNLNIAKWNILVNNLSIKTNPDISSSIVPVFPGNENISSDIIAPTAQGYFDLNFDFTDADVSFKYDITTSVDENSSVSDLVTTGYSVDGGETINFPNYTDTIISDTILLSSDIKNRSIRIYVLWNDDSNTSQMTNQDDTISANSNNPAILHVNIAFTQVVD